MTSGWQWFCPQFELTHNKVNIGIHVFLSEVSRLSPDLPTHGLRQRWVARHQELRPNFQETIKFGVVHLP